MEKNIQSFDWGYIEWIYEPESNNSLNNMSIGIVTILPNKRQNRHIHYGDEQVIYILSGEGNQLIGDRVSAIKPGQIYHMEAGIIHETINQGSQPIKHLVISIPVQYKQNTLVQNKKIYKLNSNETFNDTIKINDEISYIYEEIISSLKMPIAIFDMEGTLVIKGRNYPEFCRTKCLIHKNIENCDMYNIKGEYGAPQYTDLSAVVCPYGLTVFTSFIMFNNKPIGIIRGGHIRLSATKLDSCGNLSQETSNELIQEVPRGTLNAVLQQIKKLSKTIENYYVFKNAEIQLDKKEVIIQDIVKNEILLEDSLKSTQKKALNIRINNHFLFNVLNNIAGLAIKENAFKTYQSIIDISKILRYTTENQNHLVQLKNEIQYLQSYINLQKLRYGKKLEINIDVSMDINNKNVPFNFLQPIVENCFIHGFKDMKKDMKINVIGRLNKGNLVIEINDNGIGLSKEELNELRYRISEYEKYELSGLSMIYYKLELHYRKNFDFIIESSVGNGTCVKISLPEYID